MADTGTVVPVDRAAFERLLGEMRPKLHRYCARMTGSVIDGEDITQDALMKAVAAYTGSEGMGNIEAWLFRIAHNTALDFLRRRARQNAIHVDKDDMEMIADPVSVTDDRQAVAASLRTLMRLPVTQRSSVILMDVLGYTIQEITSITETTVPAVKAALHRGRTRLGELVREPEDQAPPTLDAAEQARLADYIDRFNARDFDALRAMLADEVKLDLVNRTRLNGRSEVSNYFSRYSQALDWQLFPGLVDGRPAILVYDPDDSSHRPKYFMLLEWTTDRVLAIRDFRYARYAVEGAAFIRLR
ncbi:MAG TPA: sigma-70 family RNA polymerase sigma factor [Magnetospirillaceae bacterium]|jgi:RNA polymerase sigma-70 factor (ECF subfamily)